MLKPISRLRLTCKGNLNILSNSYAQRFRKRLCKTIPVLSIFAFLGLISYSTIIIGFDSIIGSVDGEAKAAETLGNNTSLIIDNGTASDSTATARGNVAYSSHTIQVKAENITGYTLSITGPASITNGTTTLTGAGGATGANMAANRWGYGWDATTAADSAIAYKTFTGSAQNLETSSSATSVNLTKKLVFAAKFDSNSAGGHYRANVKLNLTITPKTLINYSVTYNANGGTGTVPTAQTFSSYETSKTMYAADVGGLYKAGGYKVIGWATSPSAASPTYTAGAPILLTSSDTTRDLYAVYGEITGFGGKKIMQDMTSTICKNVSMGTSGEMYDNRDNKIYSIQKLTDGNCWMTRNMAIDLSMTDLTTTNSDVTATYAAGTAIKADNTWQDISATAQFSTNGKGSSDYDASYGYYYNWCAATAGTCPTTTTANTDAPSSICPKGWKLPNGKTNNWSNNDFLQLMLKTDYNSWVGNTKITTTAFPSTDFSGSKYVAATELRTSNTIPASFYLGGVNWPLAGWVFSGDSNQYGLSAYYWSRTMPSLSGYANHLRFSTTNQLYPAATFGRYGGYSVRCIAYSS